MIASIVIQGREFNPADLEEIRHLIQANPSWTRWRLSRELCQRWNWFTATGQLKDMACRNLLLKLHRNGTISLPPAVPRSKPPQLQDQRRIPEILHSSASIDSPLNTLRPIRIVEARTDRCYDDLFNCLLHRYHYLGYKFTVGENMKYLAFDCHNRPLACLLFGAPAWKAKKRDDFIGWNPAARKRNLVYLTNNTRFLILPWVKAKNLASYLLASIMKRLTKDWLRRYSHPIYFVETFVDQSRFSGSCYKAANWRYLGETTGRGRQDRNHQFQVPPKYIYAYALSQKFRPLLQQ